MSFDNYPSYSSNGINSYLQEIYCFKMEKEEERRRESAPKNPSNVKNFSPNQEDEKKIKKQTYRG